MANNKSAKKRIEITKRNRLKNRYYKTSVRTLVKVFFQDLEGYKSSQNPEEKENLHKTLSSIYSLIDKGAKKNIFLPLMATAQKEDGATAVEYAVVLALISEVGFARGADSATRDDSGSGSVRAAEERATSSWNGLARHGMGST